MIRKYCNWIKEYWKKFFTPAGLAIYIATIITSSIIGKALSVFFEKKANEQIKRLEEESGSKDQLRDVRIGCNYNEAKLITEAVIGTTLSVISLILINNLPKKGDN